MIVLFLLAQVTLVVLQFGAHTIDVSLWLVFLPLMLSATTWLIGFALGRITLLDAPFTLYGNRFRR